MPAGVCTGPKQHSWPPAPIPPSSLPLILLSLHCNKWFTELLNPVSWLSSLIIKYTLHHCHFSVILTATILDQATPSLLADLQSPYKSPRVRSGPASVYVLHRSRSDFYRPHLHHPVPFPGLTIRVQIPSSLLEEFGGLRGLVLVPFSTSPSSTWPWPAVFAGVLSSRGHHPFLPQRLPTGRSHCRECSPGFCTRLALSHPSGHSIFTSNSSVHLEFIQAFSHDYWLCFFQWALSVHALSQQTCPECQILCSVLETEGWRYGGSLISRTKLPECVWPAPLSYALSLPNAEPSGWCRTTAAHLCHFSVSWRRPELFPGCVPWLHPQPGFPVLDLPGLRTLLLSLEKWSFGAHFLRDAMEYSFLVPTPILEDHPHFSL